MKSYILTLTSFVLLSSVIMGLIPETGIKKTVKLVLGLIMAILTVSPVLKLKTEKPDISVKADEYTIYSRQIEDVQKKQMESAIKDALEKHYGKTDTAVVIEDGIIHISGCGGAKKAEVAKMLGISQDALQMTE